MLDTSSQLITNDLDKDRKVKLNQKQIIKNRLKMSKNRQVGMGGKNIFEKSLQSSLNTSKEIDFKQPKRQLVLNANTSNQNSKQNPE